MMQRKHVLFIGTVMILSQIWSNSYAKTKDLEVVACLNTRAEQNIYFDVSNVPIDECIELKGAYIKPVFAQHKIVKQWQKKALSGVSKAQYMIGDLYQSNAKSVKDYQQAIAWYALAAAQDYIPALLTLGHIYEQGVQADKNIIKASEYYARAFNLDYFNFSDPEQAKIDLAATDVEQRNIELANAKQRLARLSVQKSVLQQEFRSVRKGRKPGELLREKLNEETLEFKQQQAVFVANKLNAEQAQKKFNSLIMQLNSKNKVELSTNTIKALNAEIAADRDDVAAELIQIDAEKNKYKELLAKTKSLGGDVTDSRIMAMSGNSNKSDAMSRYLSDIQSSIQHRTAKTDKRKKKLDFLERRIAKLKQNTKRTISSDDKIVLRRALTEIDHRYQGKINHLSSNLDNQKHKVDTLSDQLKVADAQGKEKDHYIGTIKEQLAKASKLVSQQSVLVETQSQDLQEAIDQMKAAHANGMQPNINQPKQKNQISRPSEIQIKWPPYIESNNQKIAKVSAGSVINIVGAAHSSSSVVSFSINGESDVLDANGLFMKAIEVATDPITLELVLHNKNGEVTQSSLVLQPEQPATRIVNIPADQAEDIKSIRFGNYHALVIGNNEYSGAGIEPLDTAVTDATSLAKLLEKKYGFAVTLLLNGNRDRILKAMESMRKKLDENDNLLIYYAGHGIVDPENNQGYWIPVDGASDSTARWLSNATITDQIRAMNARNVMVVADSCYSGSLMRSGIMSLRSGLTPEKKVKRLKEDIAVATRVALSSGGLQPVADSINNSPNSVFTGAMLKTLKNNDQLLDADSLATTVGHMVAVATQDSVKQVPRYAPLVKAGHEGGEFYFVPTTWFDN